MITIHSGDNITTIVLQIISMLNSHQLATTGTTITQELFNNKVELAKVLTNTVIETGYRIKFEVLNPQILTALNNSTLTVRPGMNTNTVLIQIISLLNSHKFTTNVTIQPTINSQLNNDKEQLATLLTNQVIKYGMNIGFNDLKNQIISGINNGSIKLSIGMDINLIVQQIITQLTTHKVIITLNITNCGYHN